MQYTHSHNTTYRMGIAGPIPKNWLLSQSNDPEDIMVEYYRNEMYLYDTDNGGDDEYIFAFDNGEFYRFVHEWWVSYDPDWELHNEYYYTKIDISEVPHWMHKQRDWI